MPYLTVGVAAGFRVSKVSFRRRLIKNVWLRMAGIYFVYPGLTLGAPSYHMALLAFFCENAILTLEMHQGPEMGRSQCGLLGLSVSCVNRYALWPVPFTGRLSSYPKSF